MRLMILCLFFMVSCKPTSEFLTPNEVHREKVILQLTDQTKMDGVITILHENINSGMVTYSDKIDFTPAGKDSAEKISLHVIEGYWFESNYYALKKLDVQMTGENRLLFVKRLTAADSRIQLYELYESGRGNATGQDNFTYYLSFPDYGPLETMNTHSNRLVPYFELKMSALVADCPSLAKKIQMKENGYFIPMASFNIKKHPDVLMRIINEYNLCR